MCSIKNKTEGRAIYLDLLRIYAIFSMMLLHVSASRWYYVNVTSFEWKVFNAYNASVRFCVPVFFMISGAIFLNDKYNKSIKKLYTHNILRVLTAYIVWNLAYSIYSPITGFMDIKDVNFKFFWNYIIEGHYHLWFICALIVIYILIPVLKVIAANPQVTIYLLVIYFVLAFVPNFLVNISYTLREIIEPIMEKYDSQMFDNYICYFLLGYLVSKYNFSIRKRAMIYILALLSLAFTIIMSYDISVKMGVPDARWYDSYIPTTLCICIAIFLFFKYEIPQIKSEKTKKIIIVLSNLCFGMYLSHDFIIQVLFKIGLSTVSYNPIFAVPINTVLVFIGSFIISFIISKVPIIRKYII